MYHTLHLLVILTKGFIIFGRNLEILTTVSALLLPLSYTHPNPLSVPVGVRLFPKSRRVRLSPVDIATEAVAVTQRSF